jgi:O-antigen/teichoic acid export membrane protein
MAPSDARVASAAGTGDVAPVSGVARRVSWSFVDQVLSSGSNFALTAFVAASVNATAFGAFTVVYAIYGVCVGLSAGLTSIPLVVRYSAAPAARFRRATRSSVGTAFAGGALAGALCVATAPLIDATVAGPLAALGVTLPGLLTQDAWRYSFVTGGRPAKAAANDGFWVVLQLLAIGVLLAAGAVSALSMVLVWGGSATAAALLACWQAGAWPAPRRALVWLREQRDLSFRYAAEAVIHRSGWWLTLAVVGALAGLRVVGAVRGAMLLLGGPLNLLFIGATFAFVSEGVRLLHHSPARLPSAMRSLSVATTAIAAVWCVIVLTLPDAVGARVLGATWHQAKPLLPLLVVFMLALATSMGPTQGMLALGAARRSLLTQATCLALDIPTIAAGALLGGARGAVLASCATAIFRTVFAWLQFRRALREPSASTGTRPRDQTLAATATAS